MNKHRRVTNKTGLARLDWRAFCGIISMHESYAGVAQLAER